MYSSIRLSTRLGQNVTEESKQENAPKDVRLRFSDPEVAPPTYEEPSFTRMLRVFGFDLFSALHLFVALSIWLLFGMLLKNVTVSSTILGALLPTQVALATVWATWSSDRLPSRLGRLAWQLSIIYFLLLIFSYFLGISHLAGLWILPLLMLPLVLLAWLPAWLFSVFGGRLSNLYPVIHQASGNQFRLVDAWRWSTHLCGLLAVMACFKNQIVGYEFFYYIYLGGFVTLVSLPVGILVTTLLWLTLGDKWSSAKSFTALILIVLWTFLPVFSTSWSPLLGNQFWSVTWILNPICGAVTLVTAWLLRWGGWRFTRKPRGPIAVK
jgi:hypothetical protein